MATGVDQTNKNSRLSVPFSVEQLEELVSMSNTGISLKKNYIMSIQLGPALTVDVASKDEQIASELDNQTLKYDTKLKDIVLKHTNVRVLKIEKSMTIRVTCLVDVFVLRPIVDEIMKGVVNYVSNFHVVCLIYNLLHVSILKPGDLPYDEWAGKDIKIDDEISFKVLSYSVYDKLLPSVFGGLLNPRRVVNDETDQPVSVNVNTDGNELTTESTEVAPDGKELTTVSTKIDPDGKELTTESTEVAPDGQELTTESSTKVDPDGKELTTESTKVDLDSKELATKLTKVDLDGKEVTPESMKVDPDGKEVTTESTKVDPDGKKLTTNVNPNEKEPTTI